MTRRRAPLAPFVVLIACALLVFCSSARAQGLQETIADVGSIDWEQGWAYASGIGAPPPGAVNAAQARAAAQRAAVSVARRNLLSVIGQVRIDSSTRIQDAMDTSDSVTSRIQGLLRSPRIIRQQLLADGSYKVIVGVQLTGSLSRAVLRVPTAQQTPGITRLPAPRPVPQTPPAAPAAPAAPAVKAPQTLPQERAALAHTATGLVLDVRGTGFKPSLKPRITSAGEVLYPGATTDFESAVNAGYARYYTDIALARQSPRAGGSPLVLKAAPGAQPTDIELTAQDAALLRQVLATSDNFLDKLHVMVVF